MRQLKEIIRYATEAPKGDPVPITKSEIPVVVDFFLSAQRHKDNSMREAMTESIIGGSATLGGHRVVVL